MPSTLTFSLKAGNVPVSRQCLSNMQGVLDTVEKFMEVQGPDGVTMTIIGKDTPATEDQDKNWVKLDSDGNPLGIFVFTNGEWTMVPALHVGAIMLYSGLVSGIPDGWHLADGTAGTPDLKDSTNFASLWQPNYSDSDPGTAYVLAPIYFLGL